TLLILKHRLKATESCPTIQVVRDYQDLPWVECYPGQLNQVFMNILANAIDALQGQREQTQGFGETGVDKSPQIVIKTHSSDPEWVDIEIVDNGPGIPDDVQKRIFEPFFTTKDVGKGTGLGMSISCRIITEIHRGQLKCISEVNQGTTFTIRLPVSQGLTEKEG
ncbi:MAG: ATP-binding protein, partial [Cyanobacteria bacterium P01_H01_bin.130]